MDTSLVSDTLTPVPVQCGAGREDTVIVDFNLAQSSSHLQHFASAVFPGTQHHSDNAAHCT